MFGEGGYLEAAGLCEGDHVDEREREAEVIRRERLSAKRRKKADKVALPAVPEDPIPPQRGGFPTDDWPEEGYKRRSVLLNGGLRRNLLFRYGHMP